MRAYLSLLKAECSKVIGDIKTYWLDYIFGNVNIFFMFLGLFYSFSLNVADENEKILFLFGLMFWYYGSHAIDLVAILIEEEIQQGTLEQLLMSKTSLSMSLFFRIIAQLFFDTIKGVFVVVVCVLAFRINFSSLVSVRFLLMLIIFFVGIIALYGIGYIIAGLSLIYKNATVIASISNNLLLFFSGAIISIDKFPEIVQNVIKLFPIYWSNEIIEELLLYTSMNTILSSLLILIFQLIFWWVIGQVFVRRCLGYVYKKGTTASY